MLADRWRSGWLSRAADALLALALSLMARLLRNLPRARTVWLGKKLGWVTFHLLRIRRPHALACYLRAMGGEPSQARRKVRQAYDHLCTGGLELFQLDRLVPEVSHQLRQDPGYLTVQRLLAQGRGLLVLTAHLGQWDLLACAAAHSGLPLNVITREIKTGKINDLWMKERQKWGVRLLTTQGSARQVLHCLQRCEIVALMMDQHEPGGLVVPFLGMPAATSASLARFARISKAPVISAFLLRQGQTFQFFVGELLPLVHSDCKRMDVLENTRAYSRVLEQAVRRFSEQWLWLHRRWKV